MYVKHNITCESLSGRDGIGILRLGVGSAMQILDWEGMIERTETDEIQLPA